MRLTVRKICTFCRVYLDEGLGHSGAGLPHNSLAL